MLACVSVPLSTDEPAPRAGRLAPVSNLLRLSMLADRYPPLDGLRVIAVVVVVQIHVTVQLARSGIRSPSSSWFSWMDLMFAMDFFFFLSGFLIGSMLLAETRTGRSSSVGRFYLRRTFRIMPPYFVVLSVLALVTTLNSAQRANLWKEFIYLTNYVPPIPDNVVMPWAWSLALEEHFYLLVPLLVGVVRILPSRAAAIALLAILWAVAPLLRFYVYFQSTGWNWLNMATVFFVQSHLRFDILVAGILTACLQRYYASDIAERLERSSQRLLLIGVSALAFALLIFTGKVQRDHPMYNLFCWGTITSVAYTPLVLLVLNRKNALAVALSHRAFAYISALAYGIYLVHVSVIEAFVVPLTKRVASRQSLSYTLLWLVAVFLALLLASAVSYVLHLLVQKPMLRLRDRVAR
jgi:peptidoglycan/LPS O-acetylase OafA/YrhL